MNGEESWGPLLASILLGVAALGIFLLELVLPKVGKSDSRKIRID